MSTDLYPVEILLQHAADTPNRIWLRQPTDNGEQTWTWSQAAGEIGRMAAALQALDLPPGSSIAISGRNTAHWFMADLAIALAGHVSVGLYPKQAPATTTYILEHSEACAIFIGPALDVEALHGAVPEGVTRIAMPYAGLPPCDRHWDEMIAGESPISEYRRPHPDDLMTLVYTSGTTGNPKGVMMTYGNVAFASRAFLQWFPSEGNERLFSYLPLAHLLERACIEMGSLIWHAEVSFLEHIDKLGEQLQEVAPTRFFGVPLVYGRIQAGVLQQLPEQKLKRLMRIPLLRGFIRRKILKAIGFQNLRSCFSGAAPIPVSTMHFFREVLGIELLEGYGMTENMAYLSACLPGQVRIGSVGRPFPDADVKLSEEGEILCRHDGCTVGYYKEPEKTAETFTADGYLRTGDKGRLDADGYLYITGRVKDIFKTAKGKYVAPAPIEGAMARNTAIDQLCLVGVNLTQPVMVVSLTETGREQDREALQSRLLADMEAVNAELEPHERIAKLLVVPDTWLPDNGFMTPTMKVKRNVIEERYGKAISAAAGDRGSQIVWF